MLVQCCLCVVSTKVSDFIPRESCRQSTKEDVGMGNDEERNLVGSVMSLCDGPKTGIREEGSLLPLSLSTFVSDALTGYARKGGLS